MLRLIRFLRLRRFEHSIQNPKDFETFDKNCQHFQGFLIIRSLFQTHREELSILIGSSFPPRIVDHTEVIIYPLIAVVEVLGLDDLHVASIALQRRHRHQFRPPVDHVVRQGRDIVENLAFPAHRVLHGFERGIRLVVARNLHAVRLDGVLPLSVHLQLADYALQYVHLPGGDVAVHDQIPDQAVFQPDLERFAGNRKVTKLQHLVGDVRVPAIGHGLLDTSILAVRHFGGKHVRILRLYGEQRLYQNTGMHIRQIAQTCQCTTSNEVRVLVPDLPAMLEVG